MGHHKKDEKKKKNPEINNNKEQELKEIEKLRAERPKKLEEARKEAEEIAGKYTVFDCEAMCKTKKENQTAIKEYFKIVRYLEIKDDDCRKLADAYHNYAELLLNYVEHYDSKGDKSNALKFLNASIKLQNEIMPEKKENKAIAKITLQFSLDLKAKFFGQEEKIEIKSSPKLERDRLFSAKDTGKEKPEQQSEYCMKMEM